VRADGRDRLGVVGRGGFWGALLGNKTCLWWRAEGAGGYHSGRLPAAALGARPGSGVTA